MPAVAVRGVSKTFELPQERVQTLKERALHPLRRTRTDTLHALRDVSSTSRAASSSGSSAATAPASRRC